MAFSIMIVHTKFKICFCLAALSIGVTASAQRLLVAVQQAVDSVLIYSIDSDKKLAALPVGDMPHEITYDPVSQRCFVSNFGVEDYDTRIGIPGRSITVFNPFTQTVTATIQTGFGAVGNMPHGIKVRPGHHQELFVNIERPDSMFVYDLNTYKEVRRFVLPLGTHNFIFSEQGNRLWIMSGANGVAEINPQNGKVKEHRVFQTPIRGLAFLGENILASGLDELYVLEPKKLSMVKHFQNLGVGQILYSAVTKDEKYILCPAPYDAAVIVVNAKTGAVVKRIATDKTPINIQVTDRYAFVSHAQDKHITKIDLQTLAIVKQIDANGTNGLLIITQPAIDVFKPSANKDEPWIGKTK